MKKLKSPSVPKTELGDKLEALALSLAQELTTGREVTVDGKTETVLPKLEERIGGFKALTSYYAAIHRLPQGDDDGKGKFGGYKKSLESLGGGSGRSNGAAHGASDDSLPF